MEDPVPEGVELEGGQIGRGTGLAQEVVPLQELMKHDPVEEAAQAQAEQEARRDGEATAGRNVGVHGAHTLRAAEQGRKNLQWANMFRDRTVGAAIASLDHQHAPPAA